MPAIGASTTGGSTSNGPIRSPARGRGWAGADSVRTQVVADIGNDGTRHVDGPYWSPTSPGGGPKPHGRQRPEGGHPEPARRQAGGQLRRAARGRGRAGRGTGGRAVPGRGVIAAVQPGGAGQAGRPGGPQLQPRRPPL